MQRVGYFCEPKPVHFVFCFVSETLVPQVQQARLDSERLLDELENERRGLSTWEERLKGRKDKLDSEKAAVEGELIHRCFRNPIVL